MIKTNLYYKTAKLSKSKNSQTFSLYVYFYAQQFFLNWSEYFEVDKCVVVFNRKKLIEKYLSRFDQIRKQAELLE